VEDGGFGLGVMTGAVAEPERTRKPNENAWLLGRARVKAGLLLMSEVMGLVGARGFEPPIPTCRIVLPSWITEALFVMA
jgi:hypothetical protein